MVNRNRPDIWKADIKQSVDLYNSWFMDFAPKTFRDSRLHATHRVKMALEATKNLTDITPAILRENPSILPILRMSTCPPIARDRLIGLAGVSKTLVESMDCSGSSDNSSKARIPPRLSHEQVETDLEKICETIKKLIDPDIFVWLNRKAPAEKAEASHEISRAATIVADRLCGAVSDPIIRNAQEKRQLDTIAKWLQAKNYRRVEGKKFAEMEAGTFSFRTNIPVNMTNDSAVTKINIPVDVVIVPLGAAKGSFPILIEAKSAGDFTNVNKRRKEEAQKFAQLKNTYGESITFGLFLCGYFDSPYLGYEAAEGIDWVWEHRIDDLALFGI